MWLRKHSVDCQHNEISRNQNITFWSRLGNNKNCLALRMLQHAVTLVKTPCQQPNLWSQYSWLKSCLDLAYQRGNQAKKDLPLSTHENINVLGKHFPQPSRSVGNRGFSSPTNCLLRVVVIYNRRRYPNMKSQRNKRNALVNLIMFASGFMAPQSYFGLRRGEMATWRGDSSSLPVQEGRWGSCYGAFNLGWTKTSFTKLEWA